MNEAKRGGNDRGPNPVKSSQACEDPRYSLFGYQFVQIGRSKFIHPPLDGVSCISFVQNLQELKGGGTREEFCNDGFKIWAAHKIMTKQS